MSGFHLLVNRDGCHMWDRKCSLILENLILLRLSMISPIHYIYITEFVSRRTMFLWINDSGLFAWISLIALSWTYFITNVPTITLMHSMALSRCLHIYHLRTEVVGQ